MHSRVRRLRRYRRFVLGVALWMLHATVVVADDSDWTMRGRSDDHNPVVTSGQAPVDWFVDDALDRSKNIRWTAQIGTVSCGEPVISGGLVWIGTNNSRPRDANQIEDASVLMCFRERDGEFLYQYVSPRLESRHVDWPQTSLASSPLVEGDRLWFCNNRCEVICLDIGPLLSGNGEPQVIWKVDMRSELGVVPRGVMIGSPASHCSVGSYRDLIFVNTINAAGYHAVPAPEAPSLVCIQKRDGKIRWSDNSPGKDIIDVQHGSPLVIEIDGGGQVIMGQGDGWLRAFDALTGELLWKFDINPKATNRRLSLNNVCDLVALPVFHHGHVFICTGRHFEVCSGQGRVCCLDPTKRGDISSEIENASVGVQRNRKSGLVWEFLRSEDGQENRMHQTLSSVAIHNGLVIAPDFSGVVHCLDEFDGKSIWSHDTNAQMVGSPLIVDDKIYITTCDGTVMILELSRTKKLVAERDFGESIEASPVYANGMLYIMTRSKLFAIGS